MARCFFCTLDNGDEESLYKLNQSSKLELTSTFQQYSTFLNNMISAINDITYCSNCSGKLAGIRLIQKDIVKLQLRLKSLTEAFEAYVIQNYKKKESTDLNKIEVNCNVGIADTSLQKIKVEVNSDNVTTTTPILIPVHIVRLVQREQVAEASTQPTGTRRKLRPRPIRPKNCLNDFVYKTGNIVEESEENGVQTAEDESGGIDEVDFTPCPIRSEKRKMLRCTKSGCPKIFGTESLRFAHIKEHDGVQRNFACSTCNQSFTSDSKLRRHRLRNHRTQKKPSGSYPCTVPGCTRVFSQETTQFCHIKKFHEGLKKFKCSYCSKEYNKLFHLRVHERSRHTRELPFECHVCHKGFTAKSYLQQHMGIHNDNFVCPVCGRRCCNQSALEYHINTHSAFKPYVCELCGYTCTSKQYLDFHQIKHHEGHHTGIEPIKCPHCGKHLATKLSLERHIISVHKLGEAKFPCQYCSAKWHTVRELRLHTNHVHLNLKEYKCSLCEKTFGGSSALRMHNQRHHVAKSERERPFQCSTCTKRFYMKKTLENHEAIHQAARPFPCGQCNQQFPSKNYLELHIYTIHDKRQKRRRRVPETLGINQLDNRMEQDTANASASTTISSETTGT